jgi:hypothetical protein
MHVMAECSEGSDLAGLTIVSDLVGVRTAFSRWVPVGGLVVCGLRVEGGLGLVRHDFDFDINVEYDE